MWAHGGLPVAISMTVQPTDQMSAALPTPVWWMTSGAIQCGVPLMLCFTPLSAGITGQPYSKVPSSRDHRTAILQIAVKWRPRDRHTPKCSRAECKTAALNESRDTLWGLQAASKPGTADGACCVKARMAGATFNHEPGATCTTWHCVACRCTHSESLFQASSSAGYASHLWRPKCTLADPFPHLWRPKCTLADPFPAVLC